MSITPDPKNPNEESPSPSCNLEPGETLLYKTHSHWIVLLLPAALVIIFAFPGVVALIAVPAPGGSVGGTTLLLATGLFFVGLAAAVGAMTYLRWESREIVLTNRRVILTVGAFRTTSTFIILGEIKEASFRQSPLGRVLGYGAVVLRQVGQPETSFGKIPHPESLCQCLEAQLSRKRRDSNSQPLP